jgi:hypothetical protein
MRKKWTVLGISLVMLLGAMVLCCGCSGSTQTGGEVLVQPPAPRLISYHGGDGYNGIINAEGKMIVEPGTLANSIYTDADGSQYAMIMDYEWDYDNTTEWGDREELGCIYSLYDGNGDLIKTVDFTDQGTTSFNCPSGDVHNGLFLAYQKDETPAYQVYDMDKNLLVSQNIELEDGEGFNWVYIYVAPGWFAVNYSTYDATRTNWQDHYDFYDRTGAPMQTAHDYTGMWAIYSETDCNDSGYYNAYYDAGADTQLVDLLDGDGNVVISGLNAIYSFDSDLIVCQKGFERGLMDLNGKWIYSESVFSDLDD